MLYRSSASSVAAHRSGVVLLVVMALLALFASVGLSFVFYADAEAVAAQLNKDSFTRTVPEVDPEDLATFFLNQLLYDTNNPYSAMRGWSLSRSIYGYNPGALNFTPYNGGGRATFAPTATNDPNIAAPMFNLVNYQTFYDPAQASNVMRTPEFYGSSTFVGAPPAVTSTPAGAYRYVGGANAPWTTYDTNSLFLAEVTADGTVLMPSFLRPWNLAGLANAATATSAGKYMSLFPDSRLSNPLAANPWNPAFTLPDADAGGHVRNLEIGKGSLVNGTYYNNDSYWMDLGFPILTAPNGKRYKAMFAPLVMDLSNRLHLWGHGNNLGGNLPTGILPGVSNMGLGGPEVNLNYLLGVPIAVPSAVNAATGAHEQAGAARKVTINTTRPHGFTPGAGSSDIGKTIIISGVTVGGYNGQFAISAIPNATQLQYIDAANKGLANSGNGFVFDVLKLNELTGPTGLYQLRYGAGIAPAGPASNIVPGTFASHVDATGLNTNNMSSRPFYMPGIITQGTMNAALPAAVGGAPQTRTITLTPAQQVSVQAGFPSYFFDQVPPGTSLIVGGQTVNVLNNAAYNPAAGTFAVSFAPPHPAMAAAPVQIQLISSLPFPSYPASGGWANPNAANNIPLSFNLLNPVGKNVPPLPMSIQEALLRYSGTNSPALTSEVFRRMPKSLNDVRRRNLITLANWQLDRVTSAPYLNYNQQTSAQYGYVAGYPHLGINEVQQVVVTMTPGLPAATFQMKYGGLPFTAAIPFTPVPPLTAAQAVQNALSAPGKLPAGATVSVALASSTATTNTFLVSFGGTLANVDILQLSGQGVAGTPPPTVQVTSPQNGQPLFTAPVYGNPASVNPINNEFSADWRSTLSQRLRVDLNRTLRNYPAAVNGIITNAVGYAQALQDRQQFAKDIYTALVHACGARDPSTVNGMSTNLPDYQASRWLAQLAVNIVDFIDNDDYSTPFNWNTNANNLANAAAWNINTAYTAGTAVRSGGSVYVCLVPNTGKSPALNPAYWAIEGWVFGVELPRLVLNEAYAQQETAGNNSTVNVWAEMFNPFEKTPAGAYPLDQGNAILQQAGGTVSYTIEIHNKDGTFNTAMASMANPLGCGGVPLNTQNNWGTTLATQQVVAANGASTALVTKNGIATQTATTVTVTVAGHGLTPADVGQRPVHISGAPAYQGWFIPTGITANTITYTHPALAAMTPPAKVSVTYGGNPGGPANGYPLNQAFGFYVVGPQAATPIYGNSPRNPDLLATYLSPTGMSFTTPPQAIVLRDNVNPSGVTHVGTTVTVRVAAAIPATIGAGDQIILSNVDTRVGANQNLTTNYNNSAAINVPNNPTWTITNIAANRLSFTFTVPANVAATLPNTPSGSGSNLANPAKVTFLPYPQITLQLRRLANPHMPLNNTPGATYNPYITVDSLDVNTINQSPTPAVSFGRSQPYAASTAAQRGNTFFQQNVPNAVFNWLIQLDRPPVNAIELMHVCGYRPHELTQQFMLSGSPVAHYAPWTDPSAMIYRFLDQTSSHYVAGNTTGSRIDGNTNLNTVTELEVFQALCDAHDSSSTQYPNPWFTQTDVSNVFSRLLTARGETSAGTSITGAPVAEPKPFKSFSAASTVTNQVSNQDTWMRQDANGPIFQPPSTNNANYHPYVRGALMQKIYNNITTTSNVYAVWWTVGYFEVDESTPGKLPVPLKGEIGRDQNRHIRHRFFAIVDRSGLTLNTKVSTANVTAAAIAAAAALVPPQPVAVTLADPPGLQQPWLLNAKDIANNPLGMLVEVIPPQGVALLAGEQAETVVVGGAAMAAPTFPNAAPGTGTIKADFKYPHSAGSTFILRGNPGPKDGGVSFSARIAANVAAGPNRNMRLVPGAIANVKPGMYLLVSGPTAAKTEVVYVKSVNAAANTFTADFTISHTVAGPTTVSVWQPPNNPRHDNNVVLHLSVIK